MNCSKCGNPLNPDTRFCPSCGLQISSTFAGMEKLISEDDPRARALEKALGQKYKVYNRIGSGGFADVYLGDHVQLDRKVAVKILLHNYAGDPDMVERFRRESRGAAKLSHPNIIDIYDVGDSDGIYFFVMKYVEGETLGKKMRREKKMNMAEAIHIVQQLADALAYAHEKDVIHRDIKPGNVMIDLNGKPVLMDFGIARVQLGGNLTKTGTLMGTPHYLPPEQPLGKPIDGRSDIYSLGIMFYEMLAGTVPFNDESPIALIYKHINDPAPSILNHVPELPPDLAAVVHRMMEKDPDDRYQARELVDALEVFTTIYPPPRKGGSTSGASRSTEKLMLLAQEHFKEGKHSRAIEIYSIILQRHPDDIEAKHKLEDLVAASLTDFESAVSQRQFERAREMAMQLERFGSVDGRISGLRETLERSEQKFRKEADVKNLSDSARSALIHDNAPGAMEYLTKALTIDPDNAEIHTLLREARGAYEKNRVRAESATLIAEADYYFGNKSYEQALASIKKAREVSNDARAIELEAKIEAALAQKATRSAEMEKIAAEADRFCEQLDFASAEKYLEENRAAFPALADGKLNAVKRSKLLHQKLIKAREAADNNRFDEAVRLFEEFLQTTPPYDYQIFNDLRKEADDALRINRLRLLNNELDQQLKKADVLIRMGQLDEARKECENILERSPNHRGAKDKLAEIDRKRQPHVPDIIFPGSAQKPQSPQTRPQTQNQEAVPKTVHVPARATIPTEQQPAKKDPVPSPLPPPTQPVRQVPVAAPKPAAPVKEGIKPLYLVIGGGVLLGLVLLGFLFWNPEPTTQPTQTPTNTTQPVVPPPISENMLMVAIDVQPWASIEISGPNLKQPVRDTTPALVSLPPGTYTVSVLSQGANLPGFTETITVSAGATNRFRFQFPQMDVERLTESVLQ